MASPEDDEIKRSSTSEYVCDGRAPCSPCEADGRILEAVGYCETCKEYLCETCFKYHRLPSPMRKHVLIDQEQMERADELSGKDDQCQVHKERSIEYHCQTHSFFGCHVCFYRHQECCRETRYIPDILEEFPSSGQFKDFLAKLKDIDAKSKDFVERVKSKPLLIESRFEGNVDAIKGFKGNIVEAAEGIEQELIKTANRIKETAIDKINDTVDECMAIHETSRELSTEVEVLQNKPTHLDLYRLVTNSQDRVLSIQDRLNAVMSSHTDALFTFEGNPEILELLKTPASFGKIVDQADVSSIEHVTDINVETTGDTTTSSIRGSALIAEGKLVIGDFHNMSLKLINTQQNRVLSVMKLCNRPRCVARVTDTSVVVAIPDDRKIVFIRMEPSMRLERELEVSAACHGVAYSNGRLVVAYKDVNKVEVIDLHGNVLREIKNDDKGKPMFRGPFYVSLHRESMYVSNDQDVKCLTLDGSVVATYADNEINRAGQVAIDSTGMVFACSFASKQVHYITSDCRKNKVLLTSADGITAPRTIDYDESERTLFVGNENIIKVYRVSYTGAE